MSESTTSHQEIVPYDADYAEFVRQSGSKEEAALAYWYDLAVELQGQNSDLVESSRIDPELGILKKTAIAEEGQKLFEAQQKGRDDRQTDGEQATTFAVFALDMDNLSELNNTVTHGVGDEGLQTIIDVAQDCIREDDLLGRGGEASDEFLIILKNINREAAVDFYRRLNTKIHENQLFDEEGLSQPVDLTVTAGMAMSDEQEFSSFADIKDLADRRQIAAKSEGTNKNQFMYGGRPMGRVAGD